MAAVPVLVLAGVDVMREGLRPAVLGAVTAHSSQLCRQETHSQNMRHTRVDRERPGLLCPGATILTSFSSLFGYFFALLIWNDFSIRGEEFYIFSCPSQLCVLG